MTLKKKISLLMVLSFSILLPKGVMGQDIPEQKVEKQQITEQTPNQPISDQKITNAVKKELLLHSDVPSYLIDITTVDGVVNLSGSINNILARERAEEIAMAVKGVKGVLNQLEINAPEIPDEKLEVNITKALANDPATESYEISVQVKDGIAMLSGEVDSWQEKELAAYVVKGVRGVKGLRNEVGISYNEARSDKEIKNEIIGILNYDIRVDNALVDVEVDNGHVKLSGTVGSLSEKKQAEVDAWVIGVKSVSSENLAVKFWARQDHLRYDTDMSDQEIKEAIHDVYLYDPRVNNQKINVEVENGIVTLTGQVDNLKSKNAARKDAKNVVNVLSVKNLIDVRPTIIPNDEGLKADIVNAMARDPYIERFDINTRVDNGKVFLYGEVNSFFEKYHTEEVVSKVNGVVKIDNNLNVNNEFAKRGTRSYEYYGWNTVYPSLFTLYDEGNVNKSDWEIKKDIESQLWWSPFVNRDEINIKVENAVVTLSGMVDTYEEKSAASQNAYEGGAIDVKNNLVVEEDPYMEKNE